MEETQRWRLVGKMLKEAREALDISKREAARRAGVSDSQWGHYESGTRKVQGAHLLPNPSNRHLEAVAQAVNLDPVRLFTAAGRKYNGISSKSATPTPEADVSARLSRVEERLSRLETLIDQHADDPGEP